MHVCVHVCVHVCMCVCSPVSILFILSLTLLQPLYAGVVGLCEDTQFTICFHREDTLAAAKGASVFSLDWGLD